MTCELLGDLFGEGSDTGMLDCDGVGFFLRYAEPARVVRGVRALTSMCVKTSSRFCSTGTGGVSVLMICWLLVASCT